MALLTPNLKKEYQFSCLRKLDQEQTKGTVKGKYKSIYNSARGGGIEAEN